MMKIDPADGELPKGLYATARNTRNSSTRPAAQTLAALTDAALALLSTMAKAKPATVSELARLTRRTQPNVSRSLHQLANHGIVRLVRAGREVRPELVARKILVDLAAGTVAPGDGLELTSSGASHPGRSL
jgi:DNA-binding transcriptional ArsR family regulator